jgi:hypothetical protein
MVNTMQQAGQSIGTALLNTIAISATTSYLTGHAKSSLGAGPQSLSLVHGYITAFWWSADILAAGAVVCGVLLRRGALAGQGNDAAQDVVAVVQVAGQQTATASRVH